MTLTHLTTQPDDPGPRLGVCPTCGCRCRHDDESHAIRILKRNAGKVDPAIIAEYLFWSLEKLEAFARRKGFKLKPPREAEPRGA